MDTQVSNTSKNDLSNVPLIVGMLIIILLAVFTRFNLAPIEPKPSSSSDSIFSAERAKSMLSEVLLNEHPHPLDSEANRITEARIVELLRKMGYQEEIQTTNICHDYGKSGVRCTNVRNIIVTIKGSNDSTDDKNGVLLSAHYDSVDAGPGASDAGVAVATLLETARLLSISPQPRNTIVLLFNEGEEYGLFGARAFMQKHPLAKKLKLAINVEARGSKGQSVMFETGDKSGWLVSEYLKHTPKPLSNSLFYEVYKILPLDTDLTVFKEHGLQGLNFAHAENHVHYHTPLDNLSNLKLGTIQHHGDNVWGVLKAIKDIDLSSSNLDESNRVYTDILGSWTVQWHENTSLILSLVAVAMLVIAVVRISKIEIPSRVSLRRGVYLFFLLILAVPTVAYLIQLSVTSLSTTNTPWLTNNFPMQLALWSGSSAVALAISRSLSKSQQPLSLLVGLTCCWIILAIATSVFVVGISYLFIIPSLVTCLVLLAYPALAHWLPKYKNQIVYLFPMLSVAIIFLPIVYILEIMVSYQMSAGIGAMFAFVLMGLVPMTAYKTVNSSTTKRLIGALLILFLVGSCWTLLQPSYDKTSPQALNIYHLQDDNNQSWIISGYSNNPPSDSLRNAMGNIELSNLLPWSTFKRFNVKTHSANLPTAAIEKTIVSISENEQEISLKLEIESKRLRELTFYINKNDAISNITFNGIEYGLKERKTWRTGYHQFRCIGLQCQNPEIIIRKTDSDNAEILILQSLYGLPKEDKKFIDNRGANAHQSQFGDRTLIISKVEL